MVLHQVIICIYSLACFTGSTSLSWTKRVIKSIMYIEIILCIQLCAVMNQMWQRFKLWHHLKASFSTFCCTGTSKLRSKSRLNLLYYCTENTISISSLEAMHNNSFSMIERVEKGTDSPNFILLVFLAVPLCDCLDQFCSG